MRKQYSGPFQAKLTVLAIGWPLLCSCWNFWCQLWRIPASETCKTHPLCPRWTTMFPPPCQQADQAATCTFALPFKFPFLSLSFSLLFSVQCSFIARRRTSRLKKETSQPVLCHNWHKLRTLFFSQTFSLALHSTTEFFVFQQSFYWTRRFDPETRAFFGYTSKLSKQIHRTKKYKLICLESLNVYPKKARVSGSKRRVQ